MINMNRYMRIFLAGILGLAIFMLLMGGWLFWADVLFTSGTIAPFLKPLSPVVAILAMILAVKTVIRESHK